MSLPITEVCCPIELAKQPDPVEAQKQWNRAKLAELGYQGPDIWPFHVGSNFEVVKVSGRLFFRYRWKEGGARFFSSVIGCDKQYPSIICPCGGCVFQLRYDSYEIRAQCTACGLEEEVYSG